MNQRTCDTCKNSFMPTHGRQRYCAPGCKPSDYRMVTVTCDCCGTAFERAKREPRYEGTFCSYLCRDYAKHGPLAKPWKRSETLWVACRCNECEAPFISDRALKYCSPLCQGRAAWHIRQGRIHQAPGTFTFGQVMRQYLAQGKRCAYCSEPCVGLPEPEHVIPLSRGGRNDMANIVAACSACNADKGDMTPSEWNQDRERRGLAPRDTTLEGSAYTHLYLTEPIGTPWRLRLSVA